MLSILNPALASPNTFLAWLIPVGMVVIATVVGWVVERIIIRWVKSFARRTDPQRESRIARAMRGHITFWGFLLGAGLAYGTLTTFYKSKADLPAALFAPTTVTYIHDGLLAAFLISLTFMLAGIITALIVVSSEATERPVVSLVTNVTRFVVFIIGLLVVLSVFDINITPFVTTLGLVGLAVSLALQASLTDLISGMLLLATRQIAVGDYVKLSTGEEGYVSDISWRTTTIRQLSNNIVIVPNSKMTSSSLTNFHTLSQTSSVTMELGVSYNSDLDLVERVTIEVAQDVMRTVQGGMPDFAPVVRFNTLGDYSIRFNVVMQAHEVTDQYLIKHEFIKRLRARYREEGISIPYPIQTVRLSEVGAASETAQASANSSEASSR